MAGLVVGAVALTLLDSGHGSLVQAPTVKPAAVAPPPPAGALVLAQEAGSRAVALAVGQGARPRLTATVLGSSGDPASGLALSFRVGAVPLAARSCGPGCYAASAPRGAIRRVQVVLPGGGVTFRIPAAPQPAAAIVARAARVFRGLRSLVYVESLRSSPTPGLLTTWRLKAPNEVTYDIRRRSLGGDHRPYALGPRQPRRSLAALAADPGAGRAAAHLGRRRHERARARNGPGRRPAGLDRLLRESDDACLVHRLDRPAHIPDAAPAHDRGARTSCGTATSRSTGRCGSCRPVARAVFQARGSS